MQTDNESGECKEPIDEELQPLKNGHQKPRKIRDYSAFFTFRCVHKLSIHMRPVVVFSRIVRTQTNVMGGYCQQCGAQTGTVCGGCNAAYYCSVKCQRDDRNDHVGECKKSIDEKAGMNEKLRTIKLWAAKAEEKFLEAARMLLMDCNGIWGKSEIRQAVRVFFSNPVYAIRPQPVDLIPPEVYQCVVTVPEGIVKILSLFSELRQIIRERQELAAELTQDTIRRYIMQLKNYTTNDKTKKRLDAAL